MRNPEVPKPKSPDYFRASLVFLIAGTLAIQTGTAHLWGIPGMLISAGLISLGCGVVLFRMQFKSPF